ncbi:MAG: Peptidase M23B [Parcubacteria group bacterium GW2011_GWA2_40_8]|nr:MAG: Peptidase M23B [Parcubacteria group bacterium GW2011_GWB1_40_14]KKR78989.1 MAG: Peptidase M23B [Parcubacteria group bacterium GW2011_GWA2_40_8]
MEKRRISITYSRRTKTILALLFMGFLFISPMVAKGSMIDDLRKQISTKNEEVKQLQQKMAEAKQNLVEAQGQARSLQNQIYRFNKQIEAFELEMAITEGQIEETRLKITELEARIKQTEDAINLEKARIASALRMLYETGTPDIIELSLGADSLSTIFNDFYGAQRLEGELKTRLSVAKELTVNLEKEKEDATQEEENLITLRTKLSLQQDLAEEQRTEKSQVLKNTKQQETVYQKSLKQLETQQVDAQKEIVGLEAKLRYAINPDTLPKGKGVLAWPVDEVRITQYYGSTSKTGFVNNGYEFHNGIDIAPTSGIGTPIYAAGDGKVVSKGDDSRYAYGRWVAVDHKNGLVTLYAHLSRIAVSNGQNVSKGAVIGYMGSTGFSTGPHLHFTVYAANTFEVIQRWYGPLPIGGHLDPIEYL